MRARVCTALPRGLDERLAMSPGHGAEPCGLAACPGSKKLTRWRTEVTALGRINRTPPTPLLRSFSPTVCLTRCVASNDEPVNTPQQKLTTPQTKLTSRAR